MKTPPPQLLAALILPAALLLSQCAPTGSTPPPTVPVSPAPADKESAIKVTLLPPPPVRLDPAQSKQLAAARQLAARRVELLATMRRNGPRDLTGFQQQQQLEREIAPYRKLKQGVKLRMKLTNTGTEPVLILYGQDSSTNRLTVRGPGAVDLAYGGAMPADLRLGRPVAIAPGGSREFVIAELKHGERDLDRWLITRPGDYQISLAFGAMFKVDKGLDESIRDADGNVIIDLFKGYEPFAATSNLVTLKVTAAGSMPAPRWPGHAARSLTP
ncbi:MAG: hypothetical protein NTW21_39740 [Verrucomicrobia bacterium]|nr:hypothetical protein [Verrucomicrobiota bacterium]